MSDSDAFIRLAEWYKCSGLSTTEALEKATEVLEKAEDKVAKERAFCLELERIKLEQINRSGINAGEL